MKKCSHFVALEDRCHRCVEEGLAREAARHQGANKPGSEHGGDPLARSGTTKHQGLVKAYPLPV